MFGFRLTPQDGVFYDAFDACAEVIVKAAETFGDLVRDYDRRQEHVARVRQLEHDGDTAAQRVLDRLDRTFITPIDREDILQLARRMDDVVDEIDAAVKRMTLYEIVAPTPHLVEQVATLITAARHVKQAVGAMRNLNRGSALHASLGEIHRLEKVGDDIHHTAVAGLFKASIDARDLIKWKEIYNLTEKALDRCEDIANTLRSIALKNG